MEWKNGVNWLCKPDCVFLAILGQFWANFGPILVQFRSKMGKFDPVKPVSKTFMQNLYSEDENMQQNSVVYLSMLFDKELTIWGN